MARWIKLKFKSRNLKGKDALITQASCARCPAAVKNIKYIPLYVFPPMGALTKAMLKALEKEFVRAVCVRDVVAVYRKNYELIKRQLKKDVSAHIANLQNVDQIHSSVAALEVAQKKQIELLQDAAEKYGPDSPVADNEREKLQKLTENLKSAQKRTEIPDTEIGKGRALAAAVRKRVIEAAEQVEDIHKFYVEVLRLCEGIAIRDMRKLKSESKAEETDAKKGIDELQKIYASLRSEIGIFNAAKVRKDFIQYAIFEPKINLAMETFGELISLTGDFDGYGQGKGDSNG